MSDARRRAEEADPIRRMLRHLCNVYGCTSYGRTADHGPEDCAWCEAEALLAEEEGGNRWRSRALDAEMALRVLLHQHRTGKPPDVERFADLAGRSNEPLRDAPPPAADEVREAATRYATQPDRRNNGVPYCSEQCPQHDGKRCRILGVRPDGICEPEVLNLLADLAARGGAE